MTFIEVALLFPTLSYFFALLCPTFPYFALPDGVGVVKELLLLMTF